MIETPPYLSPAQIGRRYSRDGKPLHPSTINRWINRGVVTRSGARVRLRALRCPGGWRILQKDVDAFLAAVGESCVSDDHQPSRGKINDQAVDDALRKLAARGY